MRPILCIAALLGAALCLGLTNESARPGRGVTPIDDVPAAAWAPPKTSLPKDYVDAVSFLLGHGLGDPRGGEYRAVTILIGDDWSGAARPEPTHGWFFPAKNGKAAWVVGPDGLIYDPTSVGAKASLRADVDETLSNTTPIPYIKAGPFPEEKGRIRLLNPASQAMVLLTGDVRSAERLVNGSQSSGEKEPFMGLASLFLTAWWHQAVTAHMRGDDALAYREASRIDRNLAALHAEGERILGAQWVRQMRGPGLNQPDWQPFDFLKDAGQLAADSKRRLEEATPTLDFASLSSMIQEERVKTLIRHLDEAAARQWGQPGGVNMDDDPIVKMLIQEGSPAVEPLLDTIESDDRLTRSVSFGRDFFPGRNLISVKTAAFSAFCAIAQFNEYPLPHSVADLRTFWAANKGRSSAKRWFSVLQDDQATRRQWMEAAERLFEVEGVTHEGPWISIPKLDPAHPASLKAEVLRGRTSPSLTDLLTKRALAMTKAADPNSSDDWFAVGEGVQLAEFLMRWDAQAALPPFKALCLAGMKQSDGPNNSMATGLLGKPICRAIEDRIVLGDSEALLEYGHWLTRIQGEIDPTVFGALVRHREDPSLSGVARKLFLDPASPAGIHQMAVNMPGSNHAENTVDEQTLLLLEMRQAVEEVLGDRRSIGKVWVEGGGKMVMVSLPGSTFGDGINPSDKPDPNMPSDDQKADFRICDSMARRIARLSGAPTFRAYWSLKLRDAAIAKLIEFVRGRG